MLAENRMPIESAKLARGELYVQAFSFSADPGYIPAKIYWRTDGLIRCLSRTIPGQRSFQTREGLEAL